MSANYTRITQRAAVAGLDPFSVTTDANFATYVGQRFDLNDGRQVALVQNAGTALAAGQLVQGPNTVANHQGMTTTAFTAYSANGNQPAQLTVTLGATAVLQNEYALGYAVVKTGTGAGQIMQISSHPAANASASVVLTLGDSPVTALDTTSVINIFKNPFGSQNGTTYATNGVQVCPTTLAGQVVGLSYYAIAATTSAVLEYGFVATKGIWAGLNDAGTTVGYPLEPSGATAGAMKTFASTGPMVGYAVQAGVTTDYGAVCINL